MSRKSLLHALSLLGVGILAAWVVVPVFGEVTSTSGQPVDGEVYGVVLEVHEDESGLTEVYFESESEELGVLVLTNGDPATGANDLDQFGGVLRDSMSCGGGVALTVANGNVVSVASEPLAPNVICCIVPHCSKKSQRSCDKKGGVTGFTSMKDCAQSCI